LDYHYWTGSDVNDAFIKGDDISKSYVNVVDICRNRLLIIKTWNIMKKKLTEESFASLKNSTINQSMESVGNYLATYGKGYYSANGNYYWVRTKERTTSTEYQNNYWDSTIQIGELIQECNANSENGYGKVINPIMIDDYNKFVSWGIWYGAYVEEFGYIDIAASSLYGNSIWLNSWYAYGSKEHPVSVEDFYHLSQKKIWRGGYVTGWDYVSPSQKILGSSSGIPVSVEEGKCTVGSIVNASQMLNVNRSVDVVFHELEMYWSPELNRFNFDNSVLSYILNNYFKATQISSYLQLNNALAQQKVVFCHYLVHEDECSYQYHDTIIISGNYIKDGYYTLDPDGGLGFINNGKVFKNGKNLVFILEKQ